MLQLHGHLFVLLIVVLISGCGATNPTGEPSSTPTFPSGLPSNQQSTQPSSQPTTFIITVSVSSVTDSLPDRESCNPPPVGSSANCNFRSAWSYCANVSGWALLHAGNLNCEVQLFGDSGAHSFSSSFGDLDVITAPNSAHMFTISIRGIGSGVTITGTRAGRLLRTSPTTTGSVALE